MAIESARTPRTEFLLNIHVQFLNVMICSRDDLEPMNW